MYQTKENPWMKRSLKILCAALCVMPSLSASARPSRAALDSQDEKFMQAALQRCLAEEKLGRLAETHSTGMDVKLFGHQMVMDHSTAISELMPLAEKRG